MKGAQQPVDHDADETEPGTPTLEGEARRVLETRPWRAEPLSPLADRAWDDFLKNSSLGQFQQSAGWAGGKREQGWSVHRVHFYDEARLMGGFSLLWRKTRVGRIGYISKGPVLEPETEETARRAVQALRQAARALRLGGLLVQPPDDSRLLDPAMARCGFQEHRLSRIVDATLILPLSGPLETLELGFHKSTRRNLRLGRARGTSIRLGSEPDLPRFMDLLAAGCARRGERPNPSSASELRSFWRAFSQSGETRLAFAECQGESVAATLTVGFGKRATLWKIGWTGTHGEGHPNELLTLAEIQWALESGYSCCDFAAFDRVAAERLLAGDRLRQDELGGRYSFLLQFGGQPKLLPRPRFYSPNRFVRWLHRVASRLARGSHR